MEDEERATDANLSDANIVQTSSVENGKVLDLDADIFAVHPKVVDACEGPAMFVEPKDPTCSLYIAHLPSYTPEQRQMIQEEVSKLSKSGKI